jgi:hypothetical protein
MRRLIAGIALALTLGSFSSRAEAQSVVSNLFYNQLNRLSDNSGDFLFNRFGGATTLDVGDILLTTFAVDTLEDLTGGGGTRSFLAGSGRNEWSGFSALEVTSILGGPGAFVVNFGPVGVAGRAAIAADGTMPILSGVLSGMSSGGMVALFDDGALHNYQRNFAGAFAASGPDDVPVGPNPPGDIGIGPFAKEDLLGSSIVDVGLTITEFGFTGAAGAALSDLLGQLEFWNATTPSLDVAAVAIGSPATNFGGANFGLNVTANPAGIIYGLVTATNFVNDPPPVGPPVGPRTVLVNFGGNANLQGVGLGGIDFANTPYDAFDDFNASFRPLAIVPEPGSLALFSLGSLLGFRMLRRRLSSR